MHEVDRASVPQAALWKREQASKDKVQLIRQPFVSHPARRIQTALGMMELKMANGNGKVVAMH
jgi:hypothetical protein